MGCLFESFLTSSDVTELLSDRAVIAAMLRVEAALARAQAEVALVPQSAAQSIIGTCKVDLFDCPKLVRESAHLHCLAEPLVDSLRETVALFNPDAANFVHLGLDHRDLVNIALTLITKDILALITTDLNQTVLTLSTLATEHANLPCLNRVQPSMPSITSFGLICCQWAAPLVRNQQRLHATTAQALRVTLSGDLISLAAMQGQAQRVMALMAVDLGLATQNFIGHSAQDESVALACELGLLSGSLGKLAAELAYMAQLDIGELTQAEAKQTFAPGSRPTTPMSMGKLCQVVQAAAKQVPHQVAGLMTTLSQSQYGAQGNWQGQLAQWPALLSTSQSASRAVSQMVNTIHVDNQRMRSNLDAVRTSRNTKEIKSRFATDLLGQATDLARAQAHTLQVMQNSALQQR